MQPEKKHHNEPISLIESFQGINDPRINRTLHHQLPDLLVIGVCSMICGGEGFTDMETFAKSHEPWLRTFLELPGGIPSHDTFNRVFQAIDPDQFVDCFIQWTQSLLPVLGDEIVAVDGKALRRAHENGAKTPCVVSAWAAQSGLTLAQVKVDEKSNEITAVPKLLRMLDLAGCIVTLDAMGCQKSIAREVIDSDARRFARACRSHWGIENSLHWTMDVTFREDESRARSGNSAENLSALRRLALNLLKTEKTQRISLRRKRLMAGWNREYLQKVLRI